MKTLEYLGAHPEVSIHWLDAGGGPYTTYQFIRGASEGTEVPDALADLLLAKRTSDDRPEFVAFVAKKAAAAAPRKTSKKVTKETGSGESLPDAPAPGGSPMQSEAAVNPDPAAV